MQRYSTDCRRCIVRITLTYAAQAQWALPKLACTRGALSQHLGTVMLYLVLRLI